MTRPWHDPAAHADHVQAWRSEPTGPTWLDLDGERWLRAWPWQDGAVYMLAEREYYAREQA